MPPTNPEGAAERAPDETAPTQAVPSDVQPPGAKTGESFHADALSCQTFRNRRSPPISMGRVRTSTLRMLPDFARCSPPTP